MDKNLEILRVFLTNKGLPGHEMIIEKMTGSSVCSVYRVGEFIYRVGGSGNIRDDISCYSTFRDGMPNYQSAFPNFTMVLDSGTTAICRVEYIGKENMEDYLLGSDVSDVESVNANVLSLIRIVFDSTKFKGDLTEIDNVDHEFCGELLTALKANAEAAGMIKEIDCSKIPEVCSRDFQPSLIHKDLTVGNIMLANGTHGPRLIDPRSAVAYLEKGCRYGSVAFDLAGYYVSLCRKDAEIKSREKCVDLSGIIRSVTDEVSGYIRESVFSEALFKLCLLVWYSIYSACRCEYCLAESRKWLYDEMVQKMVNLFSEIAEG